MTHALTLFRLSFRWVGLLYAVMLAGFLAGLVGNGHLYSALFVGSLGVAVLMGNLVHETLHLPLTWTLPSIRTGLRQGLALTGALCVTAAIAIHVVAEPEPGASAPGKIRHTMRSPEGA